MKFILIMVLAASLLSFGGCESDIVPMHENEIENESNMIPLPWEAPETEEQQPEESLFAFEFEGYDQLMNRVYATVGNRELRFDIFFPTEQVFERTPLVVGFHGGGWMAGHRAELTSELAPIIAELRANGYAFATVEYRFATPPSVVFPAPFDDAMAFMDYIIENAALYNVDTGNIGVIGYSAGAHLAMLIAYATDFDIRYCISFAGPTKMYGDDPANYPPATMHMVVNLFGGVYDNLQDLYRSGSPFFYLEYPQGDGQEHRDVPLLLVHDRTDPVVPFSQAEIMHEKLTSLGTHSELLELRGVGHDINFNLNRTNMADREENIDAILNFIYKFHKNH